MAGGLMSLQYVGQANVILNENPKKSYWKCAYKKYTHFGKQNFRIDFTGTPVTSVVNESQFTFPIKRYADLLMDTYISIRLPAIWSPIEPPRLIPNTTNEYSGWIPYEFQWIENIGAQIIKRITITCGNQKIQEYSGRYILAMAQRDFSAQKMELFNKMIGHVPELYDPANAGARVNAYPSAFYTSNPLGAQPSINSRTICVPLSAWFSMISCQAFPLVSMQYNELKINVILRPVAEWYTIRDVTDHANNYPVVYPNQNQPHMQFYRFLQTPPAVDLQITSYSDTRTNWASDIHLNCTYIFLSDEEQLKFASENQQYVYKQVQETMYHNVTGSQHTDIESSGLVSSWMFYFQRSDVKLRNQWSNYTNWPYAHMPQDITPAPTADTQEIMENSYYVLPSSGDGEEDIKLYPGQNPDMTSSGIYITGDFNPQNRKDILETMGILVDGQYLENVLPANVFNFVEKFSRTAGNAPDGLYCYNFCLNTDPLINQPSGSFNMSKSSTVEFETVTILPPLDPYAQSINICDPATGDVIGINKPTWRVFDYNFDMILFEERLNMVFFTGGNSATLYS